MAVRITDPLTESIVTLLFAAEIENAFDADMIVLDKLYVYKLKSLERDTVTLLLAALKVVEFVEIDVILLLADVRTLFEE